jgi:hypothetical protein
MKNLVPLFLLAVLFITGCDLSGLSITTTNQQPVINSFSASPANISAGEFSTLNWTVTGAATVSIDQGIGNVALTGKRVVAPAETTTYILTALSATGSTTATTQVIVTGVAPPPTPTGPPVINSFIASPNNISYGASTSLSWSVSDATSVTIDNGVGAVGSSGNTIVLPATTTTYTLTASNAAGSDTETALVTVSGAPSPIGMPVINYFTASPPVVPGATGSTFLRWSASDATAVSIEPGIGAVASSGTMLVSISASTDFILAATNAYGTTYRTVSVLVIGGAGTSVFYDFVEQAMSADWRNGVYTNLGFGIEQVDGFARYLTNQKLDDGNIYTKVLETHPQWVNNGSIQGTYSTITVPAGAKFTAKVGFLYGASSTDGVLFRLTWRESGSPVTVSLGGMTVTYGGPIKTFDVGLSSYAGKTGQFGLKVEAGASSGQDWAAWAEAKIIY